MPFDHVGDFAENACRHEERAAILGDDGFRYVVSRVRVIEQRQDAGRIGRHHSLWHLASNQSSVSAALKPGTLAAPMKDGSPRSCGARRCNRKASTASRATSASERSV